MFCRFGSLLLRRPVAATAWLKDVCTRPVSGLTSSGSASMYVPFSFSSAAPVENQPRQLVRERQLLEHLDGRRRRPRRAGPLAAPAGCSLSNRTSASCFGELMLNSPPASSKICFIRRVELALDLPRLRRERRGSRRARPRARSPTSTGIERQLERRGRRSVELLLVEQRARGSARAARQIRALAREVERRLDRDVARATAP